MKKDKIFLPIFLGVLFVSILLFFCFFALRFENPFPIHLTKLYEKTVSLAEFSNMQSLYFAIAIGISGIYLTMLSILLNARPNFAIGVFFDYAKNRIVIFLLSITILFCLINLIIPWLKMTKNSAFNFQIISIFEFFVFAVFAFKTLSYLENPKSCAKLYIKMAFRKDNFEESDTEEFYFSFVKPAFRENAFSVFEAINDLEKDKKNQYFLDYKILLELLKNLEFRKDTEVLSDGLKKIGGYITFYSGRILYFKDTSGVTIEALDKYEELYFKFYEQLFFCNAVEYPYILESAQFLREFLGNRENTNNKSKFLNSICSLYEKILAYAKQMVIFSIYRCDSVNVHSHIQDFMNLSQGLAFNYCEENKNLLETHEHFFIDILTHIINLVQMQRIDKNYLLFVFRILENVKKINITNGDFEPYFEVLPSVGWSNVVYSRNYYITLLLTLCMNKNSELYKKTFGKLRYKNNSIDDLRSLYNLLNENLKNITKNDLLLIDSNEKLTKSLNSVKEDITNKINELKKSKLDSLMNSDASNELEIAVNKLKATLGTDFKSLWKDNPENANSFYFPFRCEFSVSLLKDGKYNSDLSLITNLLFESLCNQFIKNADKAPVPSITDIPNIKNQKEIFVSSTAFDSIVADKSVTFSGQQIKIDGIVLNVHYISQKEKYVVLLDELKNKISVTDIIDFIDKAQKFVRNNDVIISVLYHLIIEETNEKGKVYILR